MGEAENEGRASAESRQSYSFRLRFPVSPGCRLAIDAKAIDLTEPGLGTRVSLTSRQESIKEADELVVRGDGYSSEEEATAAGERCRDALSLAFARLYIGADFGDRAPKGAFYRAGLELLAKEHGRVLNDVHGLMVFETEPPPSFARLGPVRVQALHNPASFCDDISRALRRALQLTQQQRLSYDLLAASSFETSPDARFLMLWMALETLVCPSPRSAEAQAHVERLVDLTRNVSALTQQEQESIVSSLKGLYDESIGQGGRRLAVTLGERQYGGSAPKEFFTDCYKLRNKLVHGAVPRPTRDEVGSAAASLERFVSDLLSRLLD